MGILNYCDPIQGTGLLVGHNDICLDPQLADFKNNYYDPNRPFNSFAGVQSMINHMPQNVDPEFKTLSNATITQCTPYSQHQNDNLTFHGPDATTTQTCYNAFAYIVYNCQIANSTVCNDKGVVDFSKNYYDAVNRPYDKTAWKLIENNTR